MKSRDRVARIRDMSFDEMKRQEEEMSEQMFRLRFQWAMGQTEALKTMRVLRKDHARLLTVMREKENE